MRLAHPYPGVREGRNLSCGGSQNWFTDENFRLCGCGVIACADTLLYLNGRYELSMEEYLAYVGSLRRYFPLIPRHGIDGLRLAIGMNLCLSRQALPYRAGWSASAARFWARLELLLSRDLPGIVSIGPNFPRVWGEEEVSLYHRTENGAYRRAAAVRAHFLTVTALDEEWMETSTWGRRLYIERSAYDRYMKQQSGALLTNLLYLDPIKRSPQDSPSPERGKRNNAPLTGNGSMKEGRGL